MTGRTDRRIGLARTGVALLLLGAATACTSNLAADRSGGDTVRLTFATIDGDVTDAGPQTFVQQLEKVSGGRLQVDVSTNYGTGAGDAESRLVRSIGSGKLDGGWPATRAFANAGIDGLGAVEAPMTLTSYAAVKDLVRGSASTVALDQLDGTGVVGLGLTAGPLRRPFAAEGPLVAPEDWRDVRFRVYNSPVQADTVRRLGGIPVSVGHVWADRVRAGTLRGGEFSVAGSGPADVAGHVTANVVLWPKVFVLTLSRDRFEALNGQQRQWVRTAAARAVRASVSASINETAEAGTLCERGAKFFAATNEQLAALHAAMEPVIQQLASDPTEAPLMTEVQAVAARYPQPEDLELPMTCTAQGGAPAPPPVPSTVSALPDGTYRVAIPVDTVAAAGVSNDGGWSGTWTLRVHDGTFALSCRPLDAPGRDCGTVVSDTPFEAGQLRGTGETVYFVPDPKMLSRLSGCRLPATGVGEHCPANPTYWARLDAGRAHADLQRGRGSGRAPSDPPALGAHRLEDDGRRHAGPGAGRASHVEAAAVPGQPVREAL